MYNSVVALCELRTLVRSRAEADPNVRANASRKQPSAQRLAAGDLLVVRREILALVVVSRQRDNTYVASLSSELFATTKAL